jgi:hypothetical protein
MSDAHIRPELLDPSIFPCAVAGCDARAAGWVMSQLTELLDVARAPGADRVYLCAGHLKPLREGRL